MQRSATTLKRLTGEVNNIDPLITMQCSLGKPLVRGIQVNATLTRTNHPNIVAGQVHPLWQWHSRMAVASPSRMCPATPQILLRNGLRNITKTSRYQPGLQIPQNLIQSSICGMCRTWLSPVDTWTQQLVGGGGGCPVVSGTRALVVDPLKVCRCREVVRLICDSVWVVRVKLAST